MLSIGSLKRSIDIDMFQYSGLAERIEERTKEEKTGGRLFFTFAEFSEHEVNFCYVSNDKRIKRNNYQEYSIYNISNIKRAKKTRGPNKTTLTKIKDATERGEIKPSTQPSNYPYNLDDAKFMENTLRYKKTAMGYFSDLIWAEQVRAEKELKTVNLFPVAEQVQAEKELETVNLFLVAEQVQAEKELETVNLFPVPDEASDDTCLFDLDEMSSNVSESNQDFADLWDHVFNGQ
jgi:hypothetical protein